MQQKGFSRHILTAFALSVVLYGVGYWFIESRRVANTPWIVRFDITESGQVTQIQIRQDSLALGPTTIRFDALPSGTSNAIEELVFNNPRPVPFDVPGGRCVFLDTTFLPGTVVLEFGTNSVQLLPRTMTVGHDEIPWRANATFLLRPGQAPQLFE